MLNSTKLAFYWRIDATSNASSRIMSPYNLQISFHIWTLIQSKCVYYFHNTRVNTNQCLYNKIGIDRMMLAKSSGHIFVGCTIWILGHNNYCFVVIFPEENKETNVFSGKRVDPPPTSINDQWKERQTEIATNSLIVTSVGGHPNPNETSFVKQRINLSNT